MFPPGMLKFVEFFGISKNICFGVKNKKIKTKTVNKSIPLYHAHYNFNSKQCCVIYS